MPNLSETVNPETILAAAFKQPELKPRARGKQPDAEAAGKAVMKQIERQFVDKLAGEVETLIGEAYETFVLLNGDHADAENKDEWESAQDDMVEETIEPYTAILSADWLARNTIASSLHLDGGVEKFSTSLAKDYYKQLTYGKTPAKIMSSAGLTQDQVESRLDDHLNATEQETEQMAQQENIELEDVIAKIAAYVGKDYDVMTVYDDFDQASDDDEILSAGAAARLGITEEDAAVLQGVRVVQGDDAIDSFDALLKAQFTKGKKKPAAKPKKEEQADEDETDDTDSTKPAPPAARKPAVKRSPAAAKAAAAKPAKKQAKDSAEIEGQLDPVILTILKDSGASDVDMAKGVGVSRATFNNYVNGKNAFVPDADQYAFIRTQFVDRINRLYEGLAKLDGQDEPEVVF